MCFKSVLILIAIYADDAKEVRAGSVPAPEQEFGQDADKENPEPLLCKQM